MGQGAGPVLTVESLLVHDGAAAQGLVVLLVAHERVHAEDSCRDTRARGVPLRQAASQAQTVHPQEVLLTEMARNTLVFTLASIDVTVQSLSPAQVSLVPGLRFLGVPLTCPTQLGQNKTPVSHLLILPVPWGRTSVTWHPSPPILTLLYQISHLSHLPLHQLCPGQGPISSRQ